MEFDTPKRKVSVYHGDNADLIKKRMQSVGLGARLVSTMPVASESIARAQASAKQEAEREAGIL
ncbi:hypothetical protein, partial [Thalassolituus alkanivorans]